MRYNYRNESGWLAMEPTVTLKEHFDDKLAHIEGRLTTMDAKLDKLVDKQADLRVEHVKTGFIATLVVACAEAAKWFGTK